MPMPRRAVAALIRENVIETRLVKEVGLAGGKAKKLQKLRGWPDRLCLWDGGIADFIETKRPSGSVYQPLQLRIHDQLRKMGFEVRVIFTKDEVDEYVRFRNPSYVRTKAPPLRRARKLPSVSSIDDIFGE